MEVHALRARRSAALAALKAAAAARLAAGQAELDLGVAGRPGSAPFDDSLLRGQPICGMRCAPMPMTCSGSTWPPLLMKAVSQLCQRGQNTCCRGVEPPHGPGSPHQNRVPRWPW